MSAPGDAPYHGRHYGLERMLNSPPPVRRPPNLVVSHLDPGERADAILRRLERLAGLGVDGVIGTVRNGERLAPLEAIGRRVMPAPPSEHTSKGAP
jgi:hypothetical protein